jgi:hypothetical protein
MIGLIAELAMEVGKEDNIDFGTLAIEEENAYNLMAANVLEKYSSMKDNEIVMLSTITHLLVRNFVLEMKLRQKNEF